MRDAASNLVRKLWQYCNVLRDDGLSYPDYVEQLTYLLFLKMSDEQPDGPVPIEYGWKSLISLSAEEMHRHYGQVLRALGQHGGTLGMIFRNAKNKIRDPAKLRLLIVDLIGQTEWSGLSADLKGDAYEGLLEKNARDTKSGAGQYFTPRPLIEAIVRCIDPRPGEVVCDPACGTAGFLLAAHDYLLAENPDLTPDQLHLLRTQAIRGVELVEEVARLATMNLLLHGVAGQAEDELPISCADSLKDPPKARVDVILTNPPFGVKGSVTYAGADRKAGRIVDELTVVRPDFWVQTANKQLNFLQHITSLLKPGGRAAVVIPDNVLFESGPATAIRRRLLETCDVHTLLRLPTGLFYAAGVKANVLFLDMHRPAASGRVWVYDLRSDNRFSLKTKPLKSDDLVEFVEFYRTDDRAKRQAQANGARWRAFDRTAILADEDARLDLSWVEASPQQTQSSLSRLDELSNSIAEDLELALLHIRRVAPH
ncbi:N-6 DNA methylase [Methylorubrum populi]|uniref:class I SAM-dependent DNA methyltransferase n=1 Tax=Methylorubrum populi TaxID=223967 RepID=UPI0031F84717